MQNETLTKCDTIKDVLAKIGCHEFIECERGLMDVEVQYVSFCIQEDAGLFVHCSGEAIMSFSPLSSMRRQIYLVVDSMAHDAWLRKRMAGEENLTPYCCPRKKLRLVQSA